MIVHARGGKGLPSTMILLQVISLLTQTEWSRYLYAGRVVINPSFKTGPPMSMSNAHEAYSLHKYSLTNHNKP